MVTIVHENGSLQLDVTLSESHASQATPTQHPVEDGSDVTDHVQVKPRTLRLDGLWTNAPLTEEPFPGRAEGLLEELQDLLDRKELLEVRTPLRTYQNMLLTDLQVPREVATGDAVKFTVTLQQLTLVNAETVELPAAPPKKSLGKQTTTPATPAADAKLKSNAADLFDAGVKLGRAAISALQ